LIILDLNMVEDRSGDLTDALSLRVRAPHTVCETLCVDASVPMTAIMA
jgi:hypothetical protein